MTDARIAMSTAGSTEEAERVARALVDGGVAACVNIVPGVRSVYRWQGAVEAASEWLLIIKTDAAHLEQAERLLREAHSYEVPEFLVLAVDAGGADYLAWMRASVG
jgi:periplasmic divalent cation tolerance protein